MTRHFVLIAMLALLATTASASGIDMALDSKVIVEVPDTANKGDTFQVTVNVQSIDNLAGFQLDLRYTPGLISCMGGMVKGTVLGTSTYWIDPTIDNAAGTASSILCVRTKSGGVTGNGILFSLTFKANSSGTASIVLKNVLMLNYQGMEIPVSLIGGMVEIRSYPPWDVNQDGIVNVIDLLVVAQTLGQYISSDAIPNPDVNRSGRVTISDLVLVAQHFGETYFNMAPGRSPSVSMIDVLLLRKIRPLVTDVDTVTLLDSILGRAKTPMITSWGAVKAE